MQIRNICSTMVDVCVGGNHYERLPTMGNTKSDAVVEDSLNLGGGRDFFLPTPRAGL